MEHLRDGLAVIRDDLPVLTGIVARSARWIHPDVFRAMPVFFPERARGQQAYDATWTRPLELKRRDTGAISANLEKNDSAIKTIRAALEVKSDATNWTCCHIYGHDDATYVKSNPIVRDPRFYTATSNIMWLPSPLKGLTDLLPEIKTMLRYCSFHLYGWTCEHEAAGEEAERIRGMNRPPDGYPDTWPSSERPGILPPNTKEPGDRVAKIIEGRKAYLKAWIEREDESFFPREQVLSTLDFWNVDVGLDQTFRPR